MLCLQRVVYARPNEDDNDFHTATAGNSVGLLCCVPCFCFTNPYLRLVDIVSSFAAPSSFRCTAQPLEPGHMFVPIYFPALLLSFVHRFISPSMHLSHVHGSNQTSPPLQKPSVFITVKSTSFCAFGPPVSAHRTDHPPPVRRCLLLAWRDGDSAIEIVVQRSVRVCARGPRMARRRQPLQLLRLPDLRPDTPGDGSRQGVF